MHLWLASLSLLASLTANAQSCPSLQGTYHCREGGGFEIAVHEAPTPEGLLIYTMSDPNLTQTFLPDGRVYEMSFRDGKGSYIAHCDGPRLTVRLQNPAGQTVTDSYYIERSALVRIRLGAGRNPQALSCAPTRGTWHLHR